MNKTKDKILTSALKLFNLNGFDGVTIRMIAQDLNMSSGNLNYHFKKKEDILEELYFRMTKDFDNRIDNLENQKFTFPFIFSEIKRSMMIMVEYRFFWTDIYHITQLNPEINQHFKQAYLNRKAGTLFMFSELIKSGIMVNNTEKWELDSIAHQMIHYSNTWIYASNFYNQTSLDNSYIDSCATTLMRIFYPYLNNIGKDKFKETFNNLF